MPYYSDNLDDVLSFDGIRNFTGGQASGLQSDLLAENQVQELYNMTLSPKGNLETRVGATSFATGATEAAPSPRCQPRTCKSCVACCSAV